MNRYRRTPPRHGFTMVELLVVIGLIALLISFSFVALRAAVSTGRYSATRTTIRKAHTQLQQRFEAYRFQSNKQQLLAKQVAQKQALAVSFPYMDRNGPQLEAFARKEFVRRNFPQSFSELCNQTGDPTASSFGKPGAPNVDDDGNGFTDFVSPGVIDIAEFGSTHSLNDDLPLAGHVQRLFTQAHGGDATKIADLVARHKTETESAVLLYILCTSNTLGSRSSEQADFTSTEIADTDGDGLLELVDSWQKPLRFYRWPTRLFYPDASVVLPQVLTDVPATDFVRTYGATLIDNLPQINSPRQGELLRDRDDPNDWLTIGWTAANRTRFQEIYHTQRTYWELLIVSGGADGDTGLHEPNERSAPGTFGYLAQPKSTASLTINALNDNVSNLKR